MSLEKIESLLEFLVPYQRNLKAMDFKETLPPEQIKSEYSNWLRLLTQFEHPLERDFFKPEWVPIVTDDICIFIDINDENMAIFEAHYYFNEPYLWYRVNIVDNVSELIDNINNPDQFKLFYERSKKRGLGLVHKFCVENGIT